MLTTDLIYAKLDSPIGELLLLGDGHSLRGLYMQEGQTAIRVRAGWREMEEPFGPVRTQLAEYFEGTRSSFDLPLSMTGSAFERRV